MKKVIAVVGPTASGKTKLAIKLAQEFHAEIISADSVAVYKKLDIGSAKPTKDEQSLVKHHLIDILDAGESYSVADCQKAARKIIDNNELSIICGGTGLYVCGIINNYEFVNAKRNLDFARKYESFSNEELYNLLLEKDEIKAKTIHMNNRNRILRALEALEIDGNSLANFNKKNEPYYDTFLIYLDPEREKLYARINQRVDEMIAMGLEDEVKSLYDSGIKIKAIGYQEWEDYFNGIVSREYVIEEIKKNTRHLAKRQKTWFKNQTNAKFYAVDYNNLNELYEKVFEDVRMFLK